METADLYSGCGTNFVGAMKELEVFTKINLYLKSLFNFGPLMELRSTSYHQYHQIFEDCGSQELSLRNTICTELCMIVFLLLNNDSSNVNALTLAHFLIGEPSVCVLEEDLL